MYMNPALCIARRPVTNSTSVPGCNVSVWIRDLNQEKIAAETCHGTNYKQLTSYSGHKPAIKLGLFMGGSAYRVSVATVVFVSQTYIVVSKNGFRGDIFVATDDSSKTSRLYISKW